MRGVNREAGGGGFISTSNILCLMVLTRYDTSGVARLDCRART